MQSNSFKCPSCGHVRAGCYVHSLDSFYCWECMSQIIDNAVLTAESAGLVKFGEFLKSDTNSKLTIKPTFEEYVNNGG